MSQSPSTSFTDNAGREWHLYVDVNAARRVRRLCGVNILDIRGGLPQLAEDPILLVDVLYVLCKEQCEEQAVLDEELEPTTVGAVSEE